MQNHAASQTKKTGMQFLVSGKVQGVWFRASTQDKARELGLTGWAKNLPNGSVEVVAFGDEHQLAALAEWLKQGPPLANVTGVNTETVTWQEHSRFAVK